MKPCLDEISFMNYYSYMKKGKTLPNKKTNNKKINKTLIQLLFLNFISKISFNSILNIFLKINISMQL